MLLVPEPHNKPIATTITTITTTTTTWPTQPSILSGIENEWCGDALHLGNRGICAHSTCGLNMWVAFD